MVCQATNRSITACLRSHEDHGVLGHSRVPCRSSNTCLSIAEQHTNNTVDHREYGYLSSNGKTSTYMDWYLENGGGGPPNRPTNSKVLGGIVSSTKFHSRPPS